MKRSEELRQEAERHETKCSEDTFSLLKGLAIVASELAALRE